MTTSTKWIIIVLIFLGVIGGIYYVGYQHGKSNITTKYLEKEKLIHDTLITKETFFSRLPARLDTMLLIDTVYKNKPITIAHSDTIYTKDSSKIKVDYFFPPVNKFDIYADIKQRIIYRVETREIEKPQTFWSRLGYSLQAGIGYGWFSKKIDTYTGIGFHYKIN
jgi:hypothetical protein